MYNNCAFTHSLRENSDDILNPYHKLHITVPFLVRYVKHRNACKLGTVSDKESGAIFWTL